MNLQQPTNTHEADGVASAHRNSTGPEQRAVALAAAGRNACPPSDQALAAAVSNMPHDIVQGLNSTEKLQEANTAASSIPKPSPPLSKAVLSSPLVAPMDSSTGLGGGSSNFFLAPSIISKVSSLSTKGDEINNVEAACVSADGNDSTSSISTSNEIGSNDGSSVPGYITATIRSTETIFIPRKKELHFFSHEFSQDYERWPNDDDEDEDSDDDDDRQDDEITTGYTEYNGRTSFVQRNGSYRKSHEMGALLFAETLHADLDDSDAEE